MNWSTHRVALAQSSLASNEPLSNVSPLSVTTASPPFREADFHRLETATKALPFKFLR